MKVKIETFTGISGIGMDCAVRIASDEANAWIVEHPTAIIKHFAPCSTEISGDCGIGYRCSYVLAIIAEFPESE